MSKLDGTLMRAASSAWIASPSVARQASPSCQTKLSATLEGASTQSWSPVVPELAASLLTQPLSTGSAPPSPVRTGTGYGDDLRQNLIQELLRELQRFGVTFGTGLAA